MIFARRETALLLLGDLFLLGFSLWLALVVRAFELPSLTLFLLHIQGFILVFCVSILIFFIAGLYEKQTRLIRSVMASRVLGAQIANTVIAAMIFFLLPFTITPKTVLFLYLLISVVLISIWRFNAVPYFSVSTRQRAVLIAGGVEADELFNEVNHYPKYYIEFISHLDPKKVHSGDIAAGVHQALQSGARLVVIDTRDPRVREELSHLYDAMLKKAVFQEFDSLYESIFDRVPLDHIDHTWLLECLPKKQLGYDLGKRFFDLVLASLGSIIATILVIPAVCVLMLTGGAPFIFTERIGKGGRPINIIKLRSMLFSDGGDTELQKKNRVTRFGHFLRRTRIDELPQLVNVLKGDLSFIGPRPELPKIASIYRTDIAFYDARHLITPGLSGWAQIRDYDAPRGPADIERTRRKLSYDLFYLKHRSFVLDMVIALKTIRALIVFSGK